MVGTGKERQDRGNELGYFQGVLADNANGLQGVAEQTRSLLTSGSEVRVLHGSYIYRRLNPKVPLRVPLSQPKTV